MSSCYTDPAVYNVALGITLIIGITLSYLPQVINIYRHKSSEGLSFWTVWLLYMSCMLTFVNSMMLRWDEVECCKNLPIYKILIQLLPIEQLLPGAAMSMIIFLFLIAYYPQFQLSYEFFDTDTAEDEMQSIIKQEERYILNFRIARVLLVVAVVLTGVVVTVGVGLMVIVPNSTDNDFIKLTADTLGIIAALIVVVVWLPQIYSTFVARDPGELSIVMLIIQMPGSLIIIVYQGIINKASWTTWLPYICNAIELLVLIVMWFFFSYCYKKKEESFEDGSHSDNERLLSQAPSRDFISVN